MAQTGAIGVWPRLARAVRLVGCPTGFPVDVGALPDPLNAERGGQMATPLTSHISLLPLSDQRLELDPVRLVRIRALPPPQVLDVLPVVPFEPHHLREEMRTELLQAMQEYT